MQSTFDHKLLFNVPKLHQMFLEEMGQPWSSDYGWRLMFQRSWVRIPAQYTVWTFLHVFVVKIVMMFV